MVSGKEVKPCYGKKISYGICYLQSQACWEREIRSIHSENCIFQKFFYVAHCLRSKEAHSDDFTHGFSNAISSPYRSDHDSAGCSLNTESSVINFYPLKH